MLHCASAALYIPRTGKINAWDNPAWVKAIEETKRKTLLIDQAGTHGCQVQVPGHASEFFADSKHGGQAAAFRKARRRAGELADRARVNLKTRRFVRTPSAADGVFRVVVKGVAH